MNGAYSFFTGFADMIADFGAAYAEVIFMFINSVFRRPVTFAVRKIRRFIRFFFRCLVIFFAPADASSDGYANDVTRACKRCLKTLFSHPLSLPSVIAYYIKKAFSRYSFSFRNVLLWVLPLAVVALCFGGGKMLSYKTMCLAIVSDGEVIGYVSDEKGFIDAKNEARDMLKNAGEEDTLPSVTYSLAIVDKNRLTDSEKLCDMLLERSSAGLEKACGVFVDGSLFAVISGEEEGRSIMSSLLSEYESDEKFIVSFAEEIEFRQGFYDDDSIISAADFRRLLVQGEKKTAVYKAGKNDTLDSIAAEYSMTKEELLTLNGITDEEPVIEEGSEIKVLETGTTLTLKEVKAEVTAEATDFDTVELQTNALYSGTSRVLLEGKKGYDQVTRLVTYIDGERVSATETSRLTVTQPVAKRIQVGTKPLDEAYSNSMGGIFLWPIIGAYGINSDYGWRWGKLHAGIDLGMGNEPGTSLGKPVIAVAQGTVLVASVHSSYGYYVIIDHGGGLQTLYAHCLANSLMVVPGQIVAAGEPIARVGSTGYSTGPHLHFEVRVNGNRVNPRPYLGI